MVCYCATSFSVRRLRVVRISFLSELCARERTARGPLEDRSRTAGAVTEALWAAQTDAHTMRCIYAKYQHQRQDLKQVPVVVEKCLGTWRQPESTAWAPGGTESDTSSTCTGAVGSHGSLEWSMSMYDGASRGGDVLLLLLLLLLLQ